MRNVFIINPTAGKRKLQQAIVDNIEAYFKANGGDFSIVITEKAGMAREVARAEAESGKKVNIFAAGGEGTAFEVLNGAVGYDNVAIGVIPCGSANDFLKYFGDKEEFLNIENQVNGRYMEIDIIKGGDKYAFNQCTAGLDAVVADNMRRYKKIKGVSGSLAYNLGIINAFFSKSVDMKIKIDGKEIENVKCLFGVCANAPWYGGGYKSAPGAIPNDGKLDYTIINIGSKLKTIPVLGTYRKGEHIGKDYCLFGKCETMEFEAEKDMPINFDGEIYSTRYIKFEIIKKGVKFILPGAVAERLIPEKEEALA